MAVTVVDIAKELAANPGCSVIVALAGNSRMVDDLGWEWSGDETLNVVTVEQVHDSMVIYTKNGRQFDGVNPNAKSFIIKSLDDGKSKCEKGVSLEDFARSIGIDPDIKKADSIRTRVFLASPYAGEVEDNLEYAKLCLLDSIDRGEAPLAPHLIYPQVLDDRKPSSRKEGIDCGLAWLEKAHKLVCYIDNGVSKGMCEEMKHAVSLGIEIEVRMVGK